MPVFAFKGVSEDGKPVSGLREADSPKGLRALLRREGVYLTDVVSEADGGAPKGASADIDLKKITGRIKSEDVAILTRQLATLIGAGIPLIDALTALVDQIDHERLKRIVSQVKQRVNEGASLADALGQHPKAFTSLYVNMIRAGESSGALDVVLVRLADFTESQARLRAKVLGTLAYPAIMVFFSMVIVGVLFVVVIPKVTRIFEDLKVTLPLSTRLLMGMSSFAQQFWWLVLLLMGFGFWAFTRWLKTERGRRKWDRWRLHWPIFGSIVRMLAVSRFARTLATLLRSGVPLLGALDIVKNIVNNQVIAEVIESARTNIQEGESIAAPLKRSGEFPPLVYHMIAIGERSGQLEEMLVNVANAYDAQAETRITALTSLLEPLMIVGMGLVVSFIVFSILLPILKINTLVT